MFACTTNPYHSSNMIRSDMISQNMQLKMVSNQRILGISRNKAISRSTTASITTKTSIGNHLHIAQHPHYFHYSFVSRCTSTTSQSGQFVSIRHPLSAYIVHTASLYRECKQCAYALPSNFRLKLSKTCTLTTDSMPSRYWTLLFVVLVLSMESVYAQTSMRLGDTATCSLQSDATIKCWGDSAYCDPSYTGTGGYIYEPPDDGFDLGTAGGSFTATDLSVGFHHVCALSDGGKVRCWGSNGLLFSIFSRYILTVNDSEFSEIVHFEFSGDSK